MKSRRVRWLAFAGVAFVACLMGAGAFFFHQLKTVHQHCIKCTGMAFRIYAGDHQGRLPYHTNGFGDALLLLVQERCLDGVAWICGPGDDGAILREALARGLDVREERCSRVYVQGLCETNDPSICILFDRRSVRGGDHRYGWGPRVREACMLDGSMRTVKDEQWPEFCREQIELLVAAGIARATAHDYYDLPSTGN